MGGTQVKTAKGAGAEAAPESNLEGMEAKAEPTGAREIASLTPMMRQYLELKALHPDAILFFRLGDFYEMFFEDAVRASELLQITLTARAKGSEKVPMCGVPYHSARRYIARLIEQGLKVAICEQMEEPGNGPGIVKREVTRIITPGMVLDEEVLEPRASNFLAAVHWAERGFGAALLEASTGEFFTVEVATAQELVEALSRVEPRELLVPEGQRSSAEVSLRSAARLSRTPSVTALDKAAFEAPRAALYLRGHFSVASLEAFGLADAPLATGAAGAALRYLKDTQKTNAAHVDRLSRLERAGHLLMDESSRANLEVLKTLRDGARKGSLLGVLDRTATSMGAPQAGPLARRAAVRPAGDSRPPGRRGGAGPARASGARSSATLLKEVADLERLCGRLSLGAGNARDLRALAVSLAQLPKLSAALARCSAPLLKALAGPLSALPELAELLLRAVVDEPPVTIKEGGLFRQGFHAELDELVALSTSGKDYLLKLETRERERTGISSLKVRYNKVFGYYIEVTKANLHLVPTDYIRKQTTVGARALRHPGAQGVRGEGAHRRGAAAARWSSALFEELRAAGGRRRARHPLGRRGGGHQRTRCCRFARCAAEYGYCAARGGRLGGARASPAAATRWWSGC